MISDRRGDWLLVAAFGLNIGYEKSGNGGKALPDGARLLNRDVFLYGGSVSLQGEAFLYDKAVLLLKIRQRCYGGSSIGKFHTQIGLGLRLIIN